ncbi:MAG: hypothetical protein IPG35_15055 [Flavobacteriales bacterium]|nr:hypothetical protein [Flavobacteriales bacterium]
MTLQGTGNGSFSWTGLATRAAPTRNPTVCMAGTYTLVVTGANGCTSTATAEVLLENNALGPERRGYHDRLHHG